MATLNVGAGQAYRTLSAAVAASRDGDVISVQAGTYVNDFVTISKDITIVGVGGMANFVATVAPPNGKGIFVTQSDVTIQNLSFSGAAVADMNGAGIRYEGGNLIVIDSYFHHNQNGLLSNADSDGTIRIVGSEFANNGAGDGFSHNIYVGHIASLVIDDSYFHDASIGHQIKSRAQSTTITNSRIYDGTGTGSYSIDLPNGGVGVIRNNVIQQGPNSDNPIIIHYGGESAAYAGSSLLIEDNVVVNDMSGSSVRLLSNATTVTGTVRGNDVYGLTAGQIAASGAVVSGTTFLSARPSLDTSPGGGGGGGSAAVPIETSGATQLDQVANKFFLHDGDGNGPSLKYAGADFVVGQSGAWTPIGAEKVGSGYQVAWKNGGADQYIVWNAGSNGNYTGSATGIVSSSEYALQSLEAVFQQDLNGDGTTGLKTTSIETSGATRLDQVANEFFLHDGSGNGPSLKYAGADFVAGQSGAWTPIGAEKVGSGYQVAWKNGGADQYIVWNAGSNGNYTGSATGIVSSSEYALQSLEAVFQQDLNGDGTTGLKTTSIETSGATRLDQVANEFFLHDGSGNGPSLKYAGADFVAGQSGAWTPIGAEKVGSGYQIAWKNGGADQYIVWNAGSNGNYTGSATGIVSGSEPAFQSLEAAFQQDLNRDGTTGLKTTSIETSGATRLDQVANEFFLHDGSGNGPSLKYAGADVVAGQFGEAWTPIGAEKTDDGYEVAWKNGAADQYVVWDVDASGNYTSATGVLSGASPALETLEPIFHQDLNRDSIIG